MTKIVEIWAYSWKYSQNLVINLYKSHVVVNGLVTFWLISTSVNYICVYNVYELSYKRFISNSLVIIIQLIDFLM